MSDSSTTHGKMATNNVSPEGDGDDKTARKSEAKSKPAPEVNGEKTATSLERVAARGQDCDLISGC